MSDANGRDDGHHGRLSGNLRYCDRTLICYDNAKLMGMIPFTSRRRVTFPRGVALSPWQLLGGLRWLVVGAAVLLDLRGGIPQPDLVRCALVMGALLGQQTFVFWLARRDLGAVGARLLLVFDLVAVCAATALSGSLSRNFFLLYPLLLVEGALRLSRGGAYAYATLMVILYIGARVLSSPGGFPGWTANDLVLTLLEITLFAIMTAVSVNIVATWRAEQAHINQLSLLDELSLLLADTRRLDDVLGRLVEIVPEALHVQACVIAINEPGSGRRIWANLGADTSALIDEALLRREKIIPDQRGVVRYDVQHERYGAIYTHALELDDRSVGLLSVARVTPEPFDERDQHLFASLSRHASQALRNARLYQLEAEAASQSREMERFKSEMLASVSHEFRLPLASITLAAETLIAQHDASEDDPERRLLRNIQRSAHRLSGFVQDVLDLARLDAHQLELRVQPCDLVALVHGVVGHIEPQCEMKHQRLSFETVMERCTIMGDGKRLEQVISNLLTNAHQYTPENGQITVSLFPAELIRSQGPCDIGPAGTSIAIGVSDTGPGIAIEERAQIFERFSRGSAGRRRSAGAGLGLHIARSVIELHGGCLWVDSNAAGGSSFWCVLPLSRTDLDSPTDALPILVEGSRPSLASLEPGARDA